MVKKWIEPRDIQPESEYEEAKRQFEIAMGKPIITLRLEIPAGFDDFHSEFKSLENDETFLDEVKCMIKQRLLRDSRRKKSTV
ncbi:MAG: hypothetical protein WC325_07335 [Candidatus Bathyarchaeia archaeon]